MALVTKSFSDIITFTRTSGATYFDSNGVLQTAGNNVPRLDYNPATLAAQGLLIEEARTNSIRNNTMQGAVAGTPGTLPTNWSSTLQGLSQTIVGTGVEKGVTYIDIRFFGTTTSASAVGVTFESQGIISCSNGQTWASSLWISLISGSFTGITARGFSGNIFDSVGAYLGEISFGALGTITSSFQRSTPNPNTISQVGAASIRPYIFFSHAGIGTSLDFTIRIGLPQLELGAFATSVIPTTTTALTRSADVASVNTLSPWFNATASTVYFEGTVATVSDSQNPYFWSISDNTKAFGAREQIAYTRNASSAQTVGLVAAGGATNASVASSNTAVTANTVFKAAASYAANDVKVCVNGLTPATTASATLPTGLNTLKLGAPGWSAAPVANAFYIRRFTYYPRSFVGAELQAITTP